jgi:hypothetical protein
VGGGTTTVNASPIDANDTNSVYGGSGINTFVVELDSGKQVIYNYGSKTTGQSDVILFGASEYDVKPPVQSGDDLIVTVGIAGTQITLKNTFSSINPNHITHFNFTGGKQLNLSEFMQLGSGINSTIDNDVIDVSQTSSDQSITATGNNVIVKLNDNDTVVTMSGDDGQIWSGAGSNTFNLTGTANQNIEIYSLVEKGINEEDTVNFATGVSYGNLEYSANGYGGNTITLYTLSELIAERGLSEVSIADEIKFEKLPGKQVPGGTEVVYNQYCFCLLPAWLPSSELSAPYLQVA